MHQNSLIYCESVPEFSEFCKDLAPEAQLFYDARANLFTIREGEQFRTAARLPDGSFIPSFKFQVKVTSPVLGISYSKGKRYIALQLGPSLIKVINMENKKEYAINLKGQDKFVSISLFDWLYHSISGIDFFIVHNYAIHLFKFDEEKGSLRELSIVPNDLPYGWFEPESEIIILGNSSGQFQCILLDLFIKMKSVKGPKFFLDARVEDLVIDPRSSMKSTTSINNNSIKFFAFPSSVNRDLLAKDLNQDDEKNHIHKLLFASLYNCPTIIHINSALGRISFHIIYPDRIAQPIFYLTIPCDGRYSANIVDNLIVVNNITENISFIYDIRKSNAIQTVGSPQPLFLHSIKPHKIINPEENLLDIIDQPESSQDDKYELSFKGLYKSTNVFLPGYMVVDVENISLIEFKIKTINALNLFDEKLDAVFFLLRREGGKDYALSSIKALIEKKTDIMSLSFIYSKLAETYRLAKEERENAYKDIGTSQTNSGTNTALSSISSILRTSTSHDSNFRASNGQLVVTQTEFYSKIFQPISEIEGFDQIYLIHIIMENFRIYMDAGLPILDETQALFFKLILTNKEFNLLKYLVQFHCFNDNMNLAEVLIKLGTKDKSKYTDSKDNAFAKLVQDDYVPEFLQPGLDILLRMKQFHRLTHYLYLNDKFMDVFEIAKTSNYELVGPQMLLDELAQNKETPAQLAEDFISFLQNNLKKNKTDIQGLFGPEVQAMILNFKKNQLKYNDLI